MRLSKKIMALIFFTTALLPSLVFAQDHVVKITALTNITATYPDFSINSTLTKSQQAIIDQFLAAPSAIPSGQGNFTQISTAAFDGRITPSTDFAFYGSGAKGQYGLYLNLQNKLTPILNQNSNLPEGAGFFIKLYSLSFDAAHQQLAFIGDGILGQTGIFLYDHATLSKILNQQSTIPNQADLFEKFLQLSLQNKSILFTAVGRSTPLALYYYSQHANLYKIFSVGDQVNGKTIQDIQINKDSLQANDTMQFALTFTDNSHGVFKAVFEPLLDV